MENENEFWKRKNGMVKMVFSEKQKHSVTPTFQKERNAKRQRRKRECCLNDIFREKRFKWT